MPKPKIILSNFGRAKKKRVSLKGDFPVRWKNPTTFSSFFRFTVCVCVWLGGGRECWTTGKYWTKPSLISLSFNTIPKACFLSMKRKKYNFVMKKMITCNRWANHKFVSFKTKCVWWVKKVWKNNSLFSSLKKKWMFFLRNEKNWIKSK